MRFLFLGERLAVDLLNTLIAEDDGTVRDLLAERGVAAWAGAAGVIPQRALRRSRLAREPHALRAFRERLRTGLVRWAANGTVDGRLLGLLNRTLARDPEITEVSLTSDKVQIMRRPAGALLDRLYCAVARSAAELLAHDDPQRLRKCANPACRLMFYDVSKAGRRRWCSMQTCGARAKVRALYLRRQGR